MTLQASPSHLSRRERQIMDIVYKLGRATVGEVMERLSGNPAYSTVRAQLRVLEEKGHLVHEEHGLRYVYLPKVPREVVRKSALKHLIDTFFEGSAGEAVAALLGKEGFKVSDEELARISELIQHAKKEGRKK
jgi:BlaI family transcriptional regulator, penicillinase repressor